MTPLLIGRSGGRGSGGSGAGGGRCTAHASVDYPPGRPAQTCTLHDRVRPDDHRTSAAVGKGNGRPGSPQRLGAWQRQRDVVDGAGVGRRRDDADAGALEERRSDGDIDEAGAAQQVGGDLEPDVARAVAEVRQAAVGGVGVNQQLSCRSDEFGFACGEGVDHRRCAFDGFAVFAQEPELPERVDGPSCGEVRDPPNRGVGQLVAGRRLVGVDGLDDARGSDCGRELPQERGRLHRRRRR
jgi:hypothetical protein